MNEKAGHLKLSPVLRLENTTGVGTVPVRCGTVQYEYVYHDGFESHWRLHADVQ